MANGFFDQADRPLRRDRISGALLLLSLPLLVAGLALPAISVTKAMVFSDTYSLIEAVFSFWSAGEYGLFVLVFLFSVLFPTAKIMISLASWAYAGHDHEVLFRGMTLLAAVGKWSMLDVFIVALTVLLLEGSLIATADVHAGILLFAGAVILSAIATQRLSSLVAKTTG